MKRKVRRDSYNCCFVGSINLIAVTLSFLPLFLSYAINNFLYTSDQEKADLGDKLV
jgi:hypothetical protein